MIHFNPSRNPGARPLLLASSEARASIPFRMCLGIGRLAPTKCPDKNLRSSQDESSQPSLSKELPPAIGMDSENERQDSQSGSKKKSWSATEFEALDPVHRQLAVCSPPVLQPSSHVDPAAAQRLERVRVASMDELFNTLVRRVGWSVGGDRRSGALCIEIGSGELEGCRLFISAQTHELRLELDAPPGVDVEVWKNRLSRRLASHGLCASLF